MTQAKPIKISQSSGTSYLITRVKCSVLFFWKKWLVKWSSSEAIKRHLSILIFSSWKWCQAEMGNLRNRETQSPKTSISTLVSGRVLSSSSSHRCERNFHSEPEQFIFYLNLCNLSFCCLRPKGPDPNRQVVHNIYCYYDLIITQCQQNIVQSIVQYKTYV